MKRPSGISAITAKALEDSGVAQWLRDQSRGTREVNLPEPERLRQPGMKTKWRMTAPNRKNKRKHYGMGFAPRGKR